MSDPIRIDLSELGRRLRSAGEPVAQEPIIPPPPARNGDTPRPPQTNGTQQPGAAGEQAFGFTGAQAPTPAASRPPLSPAAPTVRRPAPATPQGPPKFEAPPSAPSNPGPSAAPVRRVPPVRPAALAPPAEKQSGLRRFVGAVRAVLPVVRKVLPLLDGNIASVASNLMAPWPQHPVDLAPVENAIVKLSVDQKELRGQIAEQNTSLKRVEDQLGMVKEATDRNTLEQQELLDNLHSMRKKVTVFVWVTLVLLLVSIGLNVALYLLLRR